MEDPCMICSKPLLGNNDVYETSCCKQTQLHESCMNQHAHYCRKEYLKQHQNLDGFTVFCIFCKQDSGYAITQGPSFSIPSSLDVSSILPEDTVSGFTTFIQSDDDSSYQPEVPMNDHEIQTIAESENTGQVFCATCGKVVDNLDDKVKLVCCEKIVHESCNSVVVGILRKLDMNRCFRGSACLVCSSAKYMIFKDYMLTCHDNQVDIKDGIHPMAASPNAHFLVTSVVLYLHGFNFGDANPWSIKTIFAKHPHILTELTAAKNFFVESEDDKKVLENLAAGTIQRLRNVFLNPDRACDILGRTPRCEQIMRTLYSVYRDARKMYPDIHQQMVDFHADTVLRINQEIQNTIVPHPKHVCMKPCCRTLCVEAHPIIRVPTVGPLPAPSAPSYHPPRQEPAAQIPVTQAQFQSPPPAMSGFQESNALSPMERRETESPPQRVISKKDLLIDVINGNDNCPMLPVAIKTLKTIGKIDACEDENKGSLMKAILDTTTADDIELISKCLYACGHLSKRTRVN